MSEATKESTPATVAGDQVAQSTSEDSFSLSAEEADRVASQFKPTWEVDDDAPPAIEASSDAANEPAKSDEEDAVVKAEEPSAEAAEETKPARAEVAPIQDATDEDLPVEEEQGPIDIVADIPKRTEIQLKDEPSVVVPHDEPAFAPAPPLAVSAIVEPDLVGPVDRRDRNKKIVIGVVAVAALLFVVGGAKALLSGDESSPTPPATAQPAEKSPAPEILPALTAEPTATATATAEPEPTEAPPPEEPKAVPTKDEPAPPATTTHKPPKKVTPPEPPKTAAPPKTSEPKTAAPPPKPPPTKQPSGGIVRETPF